MVSCVFPGSFDPVTKGHLDLISRASGMFDHVTVAIMNNIHKSGTIPIDKRIDMLRRVCKPYLNVSIDYWDGLLADYMKVNHERIVLRGIRGTSEFDLEQQVWSTNRMLNNDMDIVFMLSAPEMAGISSSAVREIASFGGNINAFVPDELTEEIISCLSKKG